MLFGHTYKRDHKQKHEVPRGAIQVLINMSAAIARATYINVTVDLRTWIAGLELFGWGLHGADAGVGAQQVAAAAGAARPVPGQSACPRQPPHRSRLWRTQAMLSRLLKACQGSLAKGCISLVHLSFS